VSVQDAPVSTVTGAATTPTEGVTIRQGGTFVRAPEARVLDSLAENCTGAGVLDIGEDTDEPWTQTLWPTAVNADASRAFANMASLETASVRFMMGGANAVSDEMLAGSGTVPGTLELRYVGDGNGASMASFAEGAGFASVDATCLSPGSGGYARRALANMPNVNEITLSDCFTTDRLDVTEVASGLPKLESAEAVGSFIGKDVDATRMMAETSTEDGIASPEIKMSYCFGVATDLEGAFENSFTAVCADYVGAHVTLIANGNNAPSSMARAFKGSRATAIDLTKMPYLSANMTEAFADCTGFVSAIATTQASTKGDEILRLAPATRVPAETSFASAFAGSTSLYSIDLSGITSPLSVVNANSMLEGCTNLDSAVIARVSETGPLTMDSMFEGCTKVRTISFTGTPTGSVTSMKRAFAGCAALKSLSLAGLSTDAMPGDSTTMGNRSAMAEMFAGASLIATPTGEAAAQAASITLGAKTRKLLNGFFGARDTGSSTPTYVMASSVSVQCGSANGPQAATELMPRPNWTVGDTTYAFAGKIYVGDRAIQKGVWAARDYGACIQYTEADVNAYIGDFGSAFGRTIAYDLIGNNGTNGVGGDSVAWRIMVDDDGVGTLCIAPNSKSSSTTHVMQNINNSTGVAPWTGQGLAGGDGDGYSKTFSKVRVWPGVTAGTDFSHAFEGCTELTDADMTNLETPNTVNMYRMFSKSGITAVDNTKAATTDTNSPITGGATFSTLFDTSKAQEAWWMFDSCPNLKSVNLSDFLNKAYTSGIYNFANNPKLETVSIVDSFNGRRPSFTGAFSGCPKLKTISLTRVGQGTGVGLQNLFSNSCTDASLLTGGGATVTLTNVGTGATDDLDTGNQKLTDLSYMFSGCTNLRRATLNTVGTGTAVTMERMFNNVYGLTTLSATKVGTGFRVNMTHMFSAAGSNNSNIPANSSATYVFDNSGNGGGILNYMLYNTLSASNLTSSKIEWNNSANTTSTIDVHGFCQYTGAKIIDMRGMPKWGYNSQYTSTSNWQKQQFQYMRNIKYVCNGLPTDAVNNPTGTDAIYAGSQYTTSYLALPSSGNNTFGNCIMGDIFNAAGSLETIYLTSLNGSANLSGLAANATKLRRIKITGSNVGANGSSFPLHYAFQGCTSLERAEICDVAGFYSSQNRRLFYNCTKLSYADLTGINVSAAYTSGIDGTFFEMFYGCNNIVKMGGTGNETINTPGTVKLGTGWTKVWNGLFWYQAASAGTTQASVAWGTSAPVYMMYANTNVEINVGPTATGELIRSLDVVVGSTRYQYQGSTNANFKYTGNDTQKQIWQTQGYFGGVNTGANLGYVSNSTTPNSNVTYTLSNGGKDLVIKSNASNAQMMGFSTNPTNGNMMPPWFQSDTLETVRFQAFTDGTPVKARSMLRMFSGCSKLKSVDFTNLDTSATTSMSYAFSRCTSLTTIDMSKINTAAVTDFSYAFEYCSSLTSMDLSKNNMDRVNTIYGIFQQCSNLTGTVTMDEKGTAVKFPTRASATSYVLPAMNTMRSAFYACPKITSLEMDRVGRTTGSVNFGNVADGSNSGIKRLVITNCAPKGFTCYQVASANRVLEEVVIENCGGVLDSNGNAPDFSFEDELAYAFQNCPALKSITIKNSCNNYGATGNDSYSDHHQREMIGSGTSPENVLIENSFNGRDKVFMDMIIGYRTNKTTQNLEFKNCFNGSESIKRDIFRIFNGATYLKNVKITDCFKADNLELANMFQSCGNLQNLELTRVGTGKGTSFYKMFNSVGNSYAANTTCTWKLTDVGNNVANLRSMFYKSLASTGISASSSFAWTNSGNRGTAVSMGAMFSDGGFDAQATENSIDTRSITYVYDYSRGTYDGSNASYYYPSLAASNRMMMPKMDLRGMPAMATAAAATSAGMTTTLGADFSNFRMFNNCDAITSVGTTADSALALPVDFVNANMTNMECMFAECDRLKEVKLVDFAGAFYAHYQEMFRSCTALEKFTWSATKQGADAATFNIMFMGCTALKEVVFDSEAYPVTPSNMIEMFNGCKALKLVDTTGLSTASLALEGMQPEVGLGVTQMGNMFVACDGLFDTSDRGKIILGKAFKQVQNGFLWYRGNENSTPVYTLQADIYVYDSGPTSVSELMHRPDYPGQEYSGSVYLTLATNADGSLTTASRQIYNVWEARDYINLITNGQTTDLGEYGNVSVTGYVGKDDGTDAWNGTSVKWALCSNNETGLNTLVIHANPMSSPGTMRSFNPGDSTRAPWNGAGTYGQDFSQVVVLGTVHAGESVAGMFEDCTNLTSADMRGIDFAETTNASEMFVGCSALVSVDNMNHADAYDPKPTMAGGCILPAALQPTNASLMLARCTGLQDVTLKGFATRSTANLSNMLQGAGGDPATAPMSVTFENVAPTAPNADLSGMFTNSKVVGVEMTNVALGSSPDMSGMFRGATALVSANLSQVANVGAADATEMFAGCSGLQSVQITNSFNGASADATCMLAGNGSLARVTMTDVLKGTGAVAVSLAEGATGLSTVRMMDVATGANADASRAFAGCTGLTDVNLTRVAAGQRAVAREMFAGASVFGETGISVQGIQETNVAPAAQASIRSMDAYTEGDASAQNDRVVDPNNQSFVILSEASEDAKSKDPMSEGQTGFTRDGSSIADAQGTADAVTAGAAYTGSASDLQQEVRDPSLSALRASVQDDNVASASASNEGNQASVILSEAKNLDLKTTSLGAPDAADENAATLTAYNEDGSQVPTAHAADAGSVQVIYTLTDVATGAGADLTSMFQGAFTGAGIDAAKSSVLYNRSGATAAAGAMAHMFDAGEGASSYMANIQLPGLPTLPSGGASLEAMFRNNAAAKWVANSARALQGEVPGFDDSAVTHMAVSARPLEQNAGIQLPVGWSSAGAATNASMFAGCTAMTDAYLEEMFKGGTYVMDSMFAGCTNLEYAAITTTDDGASGSFQSSTGMFSGCDALHLVDLRGIGTNASPGAQTGNDGASTGVTGTSNLFQGARLLSSVNGSGVDGEEIAKVMVGSSTSRFLNGFFAQFDGEGAPSY
ncbi:MAG: BspA family leucine-rich repeat surface protein, partial [Eggerthellaceae bacterium]|nr:BspA family leucine-rich repeat surface protein [Eggerthellaceae bacterium]